MQKDLFSQHARDYARFRPDYPLELFAYLATLPRHCHHAWDCGTGNGQAALGLVRHFAKVTATDLSGEQLSQALPNPRVSYQVSCAEETSLADGSVDLICVAQALHWFDLARFGDEVRRVAADGAILAAWCYTLPAVIGPVDKVLERIYHQVLGPYWEPERRLVEEGYQSLALPIIDIHPPAFVMRREWDMDELLGYINTWSALKKAYRVLDRDPLEPIYHDLQASWGERSLRRSVTWPLWLRVGRIVETTI